MNNTVFSLIILNSYPPISCRVFAKKRKKKKRENRKTAQLVIFHPDSANKKPVPVF